MSDLLKIDNIENINVKNNIFEGLDKNRNLA
jgi:hypothetical protein